MFSGSGEFFYLFIIPFGLNVRSCPLFVRKMSAVKRAKPAWLTHLSVCPYTHINMHEEKYFIRLQY